MKVQYFWMNILKFNGKVSAIKGLINSIIFNKQSLLYEQKLFIHFIRKKQRKVNRKVATSSATNTRRNEVTNNFRVFYKFIGKNEHSYRKNGTQTRH